MTEMLRFVPPCLQLEQAALSYKQEHLDYGESELHGSALFDQMDSYAEWFQLCNDNSDADTVHPNWVQTSTFFVVRELDEKIIGMVDIRHTLNLFLKTFGGHIGYGVRPSERRKGYATKILGMALDFSKKMGLQSVMLTCYQENIASHKTILNCGGILQREFFDIDGRLIQIYDIFL